MLSTAVYYLDPPLYNKLYASGLMMKSGWVNHPCSKWVRQSRRNFIWLAQHTHHIFLEYTFRYGREHKWHPAARNLIGLMFDRVSIGPDIARTPFVLAMPEECKINGLMGTAVESYREYYRKYKRHIAQWKNREVPDWWY
jgi:hypothetical protein